jgi:plastocyanin
MDVGPIRAKGVSSERGAESASVRAVKWTRGGIAVALVAAVGLVAAPAAGAKTRTLTLRSGPVKLNGYETGTGNDRVRAPRFDGFVTSMYAHLVDAEGRAIPQQRVMLHHVFFTNEGHPGHGDCAPAGSETFYGTGEEDQKIELPAGYGYRVKRSDRWRLGWMFMNHRHTHDRVYLQYTVTIDDDPGVTPVTPYWISVSCAGSKIYSVPGDGAPVYRKSRTWTVPKSGRIVAGAAHAHGGALKVGASNACGELLASAARYGQADDPIYNLSPVLHEPAPRSMSVLTSKTGWAVRRGDRLKVTSTYSGEHPHAAVMGILHLYIAGGKGRTQRCPPAPADVQEHRLAFLGAPGRTTPPVVTPQLSELDGNGVAQPIDGPLVGPLKTLAGDATVNVRNVAFTPRRLSVPSGATVRWRFGDPIRHDVTLAGGPRAFASPYLRRGTYRTKLTTPGEYRILCSLHPVTMSQTIDVRPPS